MKTSKLIKTLQKSLVEFGDLEVAIFQDEADEEGELQGLAVLHDEGKAVGVTLCGPETLESFEDEDEDNSS